jgi:hypothetical protein
MVEAIGRIQDHGILVLSSIISGLESDTVETIRAMRRFALESGTLLAQFPFYHPLPGTKDYYEMVADRKNREQLNYKPKHKFELLHDEFWLKPYTNLDLVRHPSLTRAQWLEENQRCWNSFYSVRQSIRRVGRGWARSWPVAGKIVYVFACLAFRRVYAGDGLSADAVNRRKRSFTTSWLIRIGVALYGHFFRSKKVGLRVDLAPTFKSPDLAGASPHVDLVSEITPASFDEL